MNLIWKIYIVYNKIAIDLILYIIFKAFTDSYVPDILLHQGLIHYQTSAC